VQSWENKGSLGLPRQEFKMESPADYLDSPMVDSDDVAYPCKGCGDVCSFGRQIWGTC
jgi:hypothetical protein